MPSPILGTAAGAGEGLETLLQRLMAEEELRQRQQAQEEASRHNRASEVLTGRQIDETAQARSEATAARIASDKATAGDRQDRAIQTRVQLRPIGAPVPVQEVGEDMQSGVSLSNFEFGAPGQTPTVLAPIHDPISGERVGPSGREDAERAQASNPFAQWRGSQGQITAAQNADTAAQNAGAAGADTIRKYTIPGQGVVEAFVDPRTHEMVLRDGTPLPQNAVPYEAPPNMQIIQTDQGLQRVNPRGGVASPVLDSSGNTVQPPATATSRAMQEGAQKLLNLPDRVEALADVLGPDQFGIVASRMRQLALRVGSVEEFNAGMGEVTAGLDRTAARFATELGLLASGLGRVHGGARGGGSIQMITYMRSLLGDIGTMDVLKGRLDAARDILGMYAKGEMPPDSTLDTPANRVGGGLPAVGGTFNGGRVISVTPVP